MMKSRFASRLFQRGVAAVEAALLLVPLVVLTIGIAEGGRVVYQYNTIVKATRDSARYLSMMAPGTGHAAAKCLAVTGTRNCSGALLAEGLAVGNVSICDASTCPGTHANVPADAVSGGSVPVMNLVTVTVSGYHSTNFLPVPLPSIEFEAISSTMRQAL